MVEHQADTYTTPWGYKCGDKGPLEVQGQYRGTNMAEQEYFVLESLTKASCVNVFDIGLLGEKRSVSRRWECNEWKDKDEDEEG